MSAPAPVRPSTSERPRLGSGARYRRRPPARTAGLRRRRGLVVTAVLVASAAAALAGPVALRPDPVPDDAPRRGADHFLDRYLEPDGRVVRRDQGGDTVSEGQAYAMLVAQATDDRRRFQLAWEWARANLQRPDGLLAWHWADGRVQDDMPAADADLDAAWALVLASQRFGDDHLREEGLRMAVAILEHETVGEGGGLVLVAGPWARQPGIVNPSYVSPAAFALMAEETGDDGWVALGTNGRRHLDQLMGADHPLPPDWSHLTPSGALEPAAAPGHEGQGARYGLDAARLLIRLSPCTAPWRQLAASAWPVLAGAADTGATVAADLRGRPLEPAPHPAKLVAAASAANAAGDRGARDALMARAEDLHRESPTYYGGAWLALGRLLMTSSLGDDCGSS